MKKGPENSKNEVKLPPPPPPRVPLTEALYEIFGGNTQGKIRQNKYRVCAFPSLLINKAAFHRKAALLNHAVR